MCIRDSVNVIHDLLEKVRATPEVEFPVYSRTTHDPIASAGTILSTHRIIIMEGNYLLLNDVRWRRLSPFFDIKIFLDAPMEILEKCLIERHIRGGKSEQAAGDHVRNVDLKNAVLIRERVTGYDVNVIKKDCVRIRQMDGLAG